MVGRAPNRVAETVRSVGSIVTRSRRPVTLSSPEGRWVTPTVQEMVTPDDVANAVRLPDGSLIMDRAAGDEERDADAQQLDDAGWKVVSRRERPGQPAVITWAKAP